MNLLLFRPNAQTEDSPYHVPDRQRLLLKHILKSECPVARDVYLADGVMCHHPMICLRWQLRDCVLICCARRCSLAEEILVSYFASVGMGKRIRAGRNHGEILYDRLSSYNVCSLDLTVC